MNPLTAVIIEDQTALTQALTALAQRTGFHIVGFGTDGVEASNITLERQPQVAIIDASMPNLEGLSAMFTVNEVSPQTKIIAVMLDHLRTSRMVCELLAAYGFECSYATEKNIHAVLKSVRDDLLRSSVNINFLRKPLSAEAMSLR